MVTLEQVLNNTEFHYGNCTRTIGKRGGIKESTITYRKNSQVKLWKTRPNDYRVAIRRGLYDNTTITPDRANEWHVPSDCPLNHTPQGDVFTIEHHTRIQPVTVPALARTFYRLVCTCGHVGIEHFTESKASDDKLHHEAQVIRHELLGKLGKEA